MPRLLEISIIGCGAIGTSLAKAIVRQFRKEARLVSLYDIDQSRSMRLACCLKKPALAAKNLNSAIKKADLVIEASSAACALDIARKSIAAGRDIMVMSVGAFLSGYQQLKEAALRRGVRIFVPSGAISGIDALRAAKFAGIKKVVLTTSKPPQAFKDVVYIARKKINLNAIRKDKVLFEGNARAATRAFPQNINVAATLSLAGIGPRKTWVRIVASPELKRNRHRIEIESNAGRITTLTENVIHPANPKTSYLAVLSALATLKQIWEPIKIGA
jgi:aspartate dehydrogenase